MVERVMARETLFMVTLLLYSEFHYLDALLSSDKGFDIIAIERYVFAHL